MNSLGPSITRRRASREHRRLVAFATVFLAGLFMLGGCSFDGSGGDEVAGGLRVLAAKNQSGDQSDTFAVKKSTNSYLVRLTCTSGTGVLKLKLNGTSFDPEARSLDCSDSRESSSQTWYVGYDPATPPPGLPRKVNCKISSPKGINWSAEVILYPKNHVFS